MRAKRTKVMFIFIYVDITNIFNNIMYLTASFMIFFYFCVWLAACWCVIEHELAHVCMEAGDQTQVFSSVALQLGKKKTLSTLYFEIMSLNSGLTY